MHLGRDDADLGTGTLVILDSKFGKSRQVFLHPTAIIALRAYPAGPGPGIPQAGGGHVPRQQPRRAAGRGQHPAHVRRARRSSGHPRPARAARPEAA